MRKGVTSAFAHSPFLALFFPPFPLALPLIAAQHAPDRHVGNAEVGADLPERLPLAQQFPRFRLLFGRQLGLMLGKLVRHVALHRAVSRVSEGDATPARVPGAPLATSP